MGFRELSLADLIRGHVALAPGDEAAERCLKKVLQFEPASRDDGSRIRRMPSREDSGASGFQDTGGGLSRPPQRMGREWGAFVSSRLQPLPTTPERRQPGLDVAPLPERAPAPAFARPPFEPLFAPRQRAALLSAALATWAPEGEIDGEQLVETMAGGRVVEHLPRMAVPTLRRGVQVLADIGEGMFPFARDRAWLVESIQRVAGQPQVYIGQFVGTPLRNVGTGLRDGWRPWRPPSRGVPVVLLTDLGLGGPVLSEDRALPGEWLRFAQRARRAGCPVVAFVPHAPERWPPVLARTLTLVNWDRRTTVADVFGALRHLPRAPG